MTPDRVFPDPAPPDQPTTADLAAATRHYRAGRPAEAAAICRAVLAVAPDRGDALGLLGASLFTSGGDAAAAVVLRRAVCADSGHVTALGNLAVVQQHRRDWPAAGRGLRRLTTIQPASADAWGRLGTVLGETGDLDAALPVARRTARLDPRLGLNWFNLGVLRGLGGDVAGAIGDFRRAILCSPDGTSSHVALGEALLRLGRVALAAAAFQRALRLDPQPNPSTADARDGLSRCRIYRAVMAGPIPSPGVATTEGGVVIRGAFTARSGYGVCCHRFIDRLSARGVPVRAIGIRGTESWPGGALDRPVAARAMVNFLIPNLVERVPGLTAVTFSMFEGPRIPSSWKRNSDLSDLIVVPCESSRAAWAAQGYPEDRLRVCPLGVDPDDAAGAGGGAPLTLVGPGGRAVASYRHRFLNISDFTPRKNIDGLLRVWLRATTRADDAVLVLKLGKGGNPALHAELATLVRRSEAAVGRRMAGAAPVVLVDHALSETEMIGLMRTATHYLSLSHGEGWDLPLSNAGALGVSLIAPRHSSYLDYLDDRVARLIPASVGPARLPYSDQPFPPFQGVDWWNPDEDAATAVVKDILQGDGTAQPSARAHLLRTVPWDRAADRLLAILDEVNQR